MVLSRLIYSDTHMRASTMEITQKTCLPSVQKCSITLTQLFISSCRKILAMQKERKKHIHAQKYGKEKKRRKKDSPYLKKEIKKRDVQKGMQVPSRNSTHIHILIWLYDLFSPWSSFWLCKICSTSILPLHPLPWAPQKSLIRDREERDDPMPRWGIIHIEWSERIVVEQSYIFLSKDKSYLARGVDLIWLSTLALKIMI